MTTPGSLDRWTFCSLGHVHWDAHGGAGLLLRYVPATWGAGRHVAPDTSVSVPHFRAEIT
jgi:hypothetical protein